MGIFDKLFNKENKQELDKGLQKTKQSLFEKISRALVGKSTIDEDFLDELESILITADVGVETTIKIITRLQERVSKEKFVGHDELMTLLIEEVKQLLTDNKSNDVEEFKCGPEKPHIILVVGVNGVGKTTSIGKLAYQLKLSGKKALLRPVIHSGQLPKTSLKFGPTVLVVNFLPKEWVQTPPQLPTKPASTL